MRDASRAFVEMHPEKTDYAHYHSNDETWPNVEYVLRTSYTEKINMSRSRLR